MKRAIRIVYTARLLSSLFDSHGVPIRLSWRFSVPKNPANNSSSPKDHPARADE